MLTRAAPYQLIREIAGSHSLECDQQWILTAMGQHGEGLVNMLWRILGSEQDVCDVYQDTFVQLANSNLGEKPRNVKAYLFRTASNIAVSILRRKTVHNKACRNIAKNSADSHTVDYIGDMDSRDMQAELRGCITTLPEKMRQIILLRDLAEMPYSQAAKIMNITPASARVYRRRAIRRLAEKMNVKNKMLQTIKHPDGQDKAAQKDCSVNMR